MLTPHCRQSYQRLWEWDPSIVFFEAPRCVDLQSRLRTTALACQSLHHPTLKCSARLSWRGTAGRQGKGQFPEQILNSGQDLRQIGCVTCMHQSQDKNVKNVTPFPKPTSFLSVKQAMDLLPHASQQGDHPWRQQGLNTPNLSASVAVDTGLTNAAKLPQQRRRCTKVTCEIRVTKVNFTPHKNTEDVMRENLGMSQKLRKVCDTVPTCEL